MRSSASPISTERARRPRAPRKLHEDECAAALFAEELGIARKTGDVRLYAEAVEGAGRCRCGSGSFTTGARLFGGVRVLLEEAGPSPWAAVTAEDERRLRAALGEAVFDATLAEGQSMTKEQVIAYALLAAREGEVAVSERRRADRDSNHCPRAVVQ